jgi:hypothetical protein
LVLEEIDPSTIDAPKPIAPFPICPRALPLPELATIVSPSAMSGGEQQVRLDVTVAEIDRAKLRARGKNTVDSASADSVGSVLGDLRGSSGGSVNNSVAPVDRIKSRLRGINVIVGGNSIASGVVGSAPNNTSALPASRPNIIYGIVPPQLRKMLEVLKKDDIARALAEPTLITLNGCRANFQVGGIVPVPCPNASADKPGVTFRPVGVQIGLLPLVDGDGKIHLDVDMSVCTVNRGLGINTINGVVPGFDEKQAKFSVVLDAGQTVAIGGPSIHTAMKTDDEYELIILITPHLVDPKDCNQGANVAAPVYGPAPMKPCGAIDSCPAQPACRESCPGNMNLADVAALSMSKVSDDIILNQIRTTGTVFCLATEEIIWLKKNGVSDRVVIEMQNTRSRAMESMKVTQGGSRAEGRTRDPLERSEDLRKLREVKTDRTWQTNEPSSVSYERTNGYIGP